MTYVKQTLELTHQATLEMLHAAVAAAEQINQPQCIVIVDKSGETLASIRMNGAKFLSLLSARTKARTAASTGGASANVPTAVAPLIAAATDGGMTGLGGGFPIYVDGTLVGGIGVGSGTVEQDSSVALAALAIIGAVHEPPKT
ncbi:MAG: heme-binding protein [Sulfitobacter sp.]